jgi:hypothetical protein
MTQQEFKERIQQFQRGYLPADHLRMLLDQREMSTEIRKEIELVLALDGVLRKVLRQFALSRQGHPLVEQRLREPTTLVETTQTIKSFEYEPKILTETEKNTIDFRGLIGNLPVPEGAAERLVARLKNAYAAEGLDRTEGMAPDAEQEDIEFQEENLFLANEWDVRTPMDITSELGAVAGTLDERHPRGKIIPISRWHPPQIGTERDVMAATEGSEEETGGQDSTSDMDESKKSPDEPK